eukprot:CAMPEP_0196718642 /NCGR_PEP_ID=MMETSP1091-20130531/1799_1 /TAXON_ID=302021 /ORGANISM="Rhodomonas sp., Strain CCMP768" /LENGTH=190 /DNA_ID=CAMNT_0042059357 /DNA_START=9 /DNA_END=581 /DNA_ORIENTATION=+
MPASCLACVWRKLSKPRKGSGHNLQRTQSARSTLNGEDALLVADVLRVPGGNTAELRRVAQLTPQSSDAAASADRELSSRKLEVIEEDKERVGPEFIEETIATNPIAEEDDDKSSFHRLSQAQRDRSFKTNRFKLSKQDSKLWDLDGWNDPDLCRKSSAIENWLQCGSVSGRTGISVRSSNSAYTGLIEM